MPAKRMGEVPPRQLPERDARTKQGDIMIAPFATASLISPLLAETITITAWRLQSTVVVAPLLN